MKASDQARLLAWVRAAITAVVDRTVVHPDSQEGWRVGLNQIWLGKLQGFETCLERGRFDDRGLRHLAISVHCMLLDISSSNAENKARSERESAALDSLLKEVKS